MTTIITDHLLEERIRAERAATGADHYDEVWDGVYIMAPMANNEHQDFVGFLTGIIQETIRRPRLGKVLPGTNVTDREDDWTLNYRVPDVAVFLNGTRAQNRGTHWFGGPDFAIEVVSVDDNSREKIPFYEKVGTRELLVIDRDPWSLELYRLSDGQLQLVGTVHTGDGNSVLSEVVGLSFQLLTGEERPELLVTQPASDKQWRE